MDKILDGTAADEETTKRVQKQFSIFAPTDSAFEKLDPQLKRKIKEGAACAENILKNHILDLTFCSSAVVDDEDAKVTTYNMLGEKMSFERSAVDPEKSTNEISNVSKASPVLINEKARIVEEDIMGTNGVLHVIDTVLETQSGLPISTMLSKKNLTIFRKLMEYGSFDNVYDNLDNATYFVPSDEAFENSEVGKHWIKQLEEAPQKLKNNENLKQLLDYHVVQPLTRSCDLSEKMLPTLADSQSLRVNLYTTHPGFTHVMNRATVNCARLVHFDQDSCGSVMHQIDKVLSPPSGNLLQMLEANSHYSQFLKMVKKANLTSLLEDSSTDGFTLFVPRDDVFSEVSEWIAEKSPAEQEELIKNHIVPDVMCCSGFVRSEWPFTRTIETINKNSLIINRDRRPKVQNAGITKCDIVATNGVINEINDVINVQPRRQEPQNNFYNSFFNRPFFF